MTLSFFFVWDPLWMGATLVGLLMGMVAQVRVKRAFAKYSKVAVRSGMTGAEAAAAVCRAAGVSEVSIERHQGFLSDHYDPSSRTLRLSPEVHDGRSISSIAVAAHEAGHSIQHAQGYMMLAVRSKLVPVVQVSSRIWYLPFFVGMMLNGPGSVMGPLLMDIAIVLFGAMVVFQLVTLPVEFDASRRAKAVLATSGIVSTPDEARGVEKVLGAAALTYVAAAAAAVLQLVVLLMRSRR